MTEPDAAPRRSRRAGFGSLGAGVLVALALPPWGWWPLAFVGLALLHLLLAERPGRSRFARGFLFGVGWLAPGMGWMWFLTAPGYVFAFLLFAVVVGGACALVPSDHRLIVALPLAMVLSEAVRLCFPFGGVPLATLAIGQADGPLAPVVRVGGVLLLAAVTVVAGGALASGWHLWRRSAATDGLHGSWRPAAVGLAVVVLAAGLGHIAPHGTDIGRSLRIAVVQGGGPQGTHAISSDNRAVVLRHLAATRTITGGVDVVVWPENVIDVASFADSQERIEVAAEAARLGVPLVIGITEDATAGHFVNAQVVVLPDGSMASRYEKVRRVPFGEYMPLRSLLKALGAPTDRVPRDAVAGHDPAVVDLPATDARPAVVLGVVISWEVFFGGRARDAIGHGGQVLLNPTNGSSYTGTVLQTQQVASSRLRALETGRWVAQAAPTGFSVFVAPDGDVHDRTAISEAKVIIRAVPLRRGHTWYASIGEIPTVILASAGLVALQWAARRRGQATLSSSEATAQGASAGE